MGQGTAQGTSIVFPVQATAQQVRRVVADDLREAVRGKSLADARSTLEAYGTTTISLWPGFASSIPSYDFRIDLTVKSDIVVETGSPAPGSSQRPVFFRFRRGDSPVEQLREPVVERVPQGVAQDDPEADEGHGEPGALSRLLGIDLGERRIGLRSRTRTARRPGRSPRSAARAGSKAISRPSTGSSASRTSASSSSACPSRRPGPMGRRPASPGRGRRRCARQSGSRWRTVTNA